MIDSWRIVEAHRYGGPGYLAGEPREDDEDVDAPDGRTLVLNVPRSMRVIVSDRATRRPIAHTHSAADGTWRIDGIRPGIPLSVEFVNDGAYTVDVPGVGVVPVNSFVQDWIYARPYDEDE